MRRIAAIAAVLALGIIVVVTRPATGQDVTLDDRVSALETRVTAQDQVIADLRTTVASLKPAVAAVPSSSPTADKPTPLTVIVGADERVTRPYAVGPGVVQVCATRIAPPPPQYGVYEYGILLKVVFDPNTDQISSGLYFYETGCKTLQLNRRQSTFVLQTDGSSWNVTVTPQ